MIHPTPESHPTASTTGTDRLDWSVVAALVALWGLMAVIINPIGDFPLNDDFVYGLPVQWLVEEGRLGTVYQNAAFFTQMVWGTLFAYLGGFSYTVLRISTLVAGAVGLMATYLVAREVGFSRAVATIVAGLLLINPVFVSLANTFMTDVPFLAIAMLSLLLLLRGLKHDRPVYLWAGWAALLAATLLRQVAIAIAVGLVVAMAMKRGMNRAWLIRAVVPTAALLGVVQAYRLLLEATDLLPAAYDQYINDLKLVFKSLVHLRLGALKPAIRGGGFALMHLGLWMLPLSLLSLPHWSGATTRRGLFITLAALVSIAAIVTVILWFNGMLMPLGSSGTILVDFGTGIHGIHTSGGGQPPHAPRWFWVAITGASAFGATAIVLALGRVARYAVAQVHSGQARQTLWLPTFLLVSSVLIYGPLLAQYGPWFDRYLLTVMVLLVLFIGTTIGIVAQPRSIPAARLLVPMALALLYLGFAVASAHDYLAWNRQRWAAAASLMAHGAVAPDDIRGGYEFDQYSAWRDLPSKMTNASRAAFFERPGQSKERARYAIVFSEQQGFNHLRSLPVDRWLPWSPDKILILERRGDAGPVPLGDPGRQIPPG